MDIACRTATVRLKYQLHEIRVTEPYSRHQSGKIERSKGSLEIRIMGIGALR